MAETDLTALEQLEQRYPAIPWRADAGQGDGRADALRASDIIVNKEDLLLIYCRSWRDSWHGPRPYEPPRVFRRLFGLSHAAMSGCSSMA